MFSKENLSHIATSYSLLSPGLQVLENIIREYEEKNNDSDEYRLLTQFEKNTYQQIIDFKTHTISLIGLIQSYLSNLLKQDDSSDINNINKIIAEASKKAILKTALPEVLSNLIKNLSEFERVVYHNNTNEKDKQLCHITLQQLVQLTNEIGKLNKN